MFGPRPEKVFIAPAAETEQPGVLRCLAPVSNHLYKKKRFRDDQRNLVRANLLNTKAPKAKITPSVPAMNFKAE
jgi:hypothetical protein